MSSNKHDSRSIPPPRGDRAVRALGNIIFLSRWLQAPLYLGLIAAQTVYVYQFMRELVHLFERANSITETDIMLTVLGLIDVVMIANLLIMVIVGGYETFVSRLNLQGHPDQPEWLSHVNAGVLKVKLATALIGISSIHLLKTFINTQNIGKKAVEVSEAVGHGANAAVADGHAAMVSQPLDERTVIWQVVIHLTFVASAIALAITDKIASPPRPEH